MAFAELGDARRAWDVWNLVNPIAHGASRAAIDTYKVEPYVVAADVYAIAPHVGRGGWTWYTGSAAWMYRLIVESLLGFRLSRANGCESCRACQWTGRASRCTTGFRETVYHIDVHQTPHATGDQRLSLDGQALPGMAVPLVDDRVEHRVDVWVRSSRHSQSAGSARPQPSCPAAEADVRLAWNRPPTAAVRKNVASVLNGTDARRRGVVRCDQGLRGDAVRGVDARCTRPWSGEIEMLYTIAVVLLILWLLGVVGTYTIGPLVHLLLVVALVVFVARMSGRSPLRRLAPLASGVRDGGFRSST